MTPSETVSLATPTSLQNLAPSSYLVDLRDNALNLTSSYLRVPSVHDLVTFPVRAVSVIDHALFRTFPRWALQQTGLIPIATGTENIAQAAAGDAAAAGAGQAAAGGWASTSINNWSSLISDIFGGSTFNSYWGMLQYVTSRWAFTCFIMALVLNRVQVYGASRQRIVLTWNKRFALRLLPIMLFIPQIFQVLSAIRCQTSPNFSLYRHGDNDKYTALDWSTDGGALHTLSSTILFRQTDEQACAAVQMSRPSPDVRAPYGSFSLLWPSFMKLSISHLIESLSCSLQQTHMTTEVGMSIFEHSLAFAEAETMITSTISLLAKDIKARSNATASASSSKMTSSPSKNTVVASGAIMALSDAISALTSPHILDRINVPVEVLLVALLSSCNALSSHVVAILGRQRKWRLLNTGFWGICFMTSFIWGFMSPSSMEREFGDSRPVSSLLHFPTVALLGFLPHMCILVGIMVCVVIYVVALTLTAVSLGTNPAIPQPAGLKDRFMIAHDNLAAAIQLRRIDVRWHEDFYTALLRVGFTALTAASEAVFLNEGRSVEMRQFTWLEEERLDELQAARSQRSLDGDTNSNFQIIEEYGVPSSSPGGTDKGGVWESGYAKERKFDKKEGELEGKDSFAYPTPRQGGIGAMQRTTRFYLLFIYLRGIATLISGWIAFGTGKALDTIGVTTRPRWLRRMVGRSFKRIQDDRDRTVQGANDLMDSWLTGDGRLSLKRGDDVDVESELRRRIMLEGGSEVDDVLDQRMYDWWRKGGTFGSKDESGGYAPSHIDDEDNTSVVSMSTASTTTSHGNDSEWESEDEGQRTPTQMSALPTQSWSFSNVETRTRESTPSSLSAIDTPLDPATLARLLNPQTKEDKEEAQILASHFATSTSNDAKSNRIMTRSRYRKQQDSERARVLLAGRTTNVPTISLFDTSSQPSRPRPLTRAEEEEALEALIIERRKRKALSSQPSAPSQDVDDDSRLTGPPCVVCQSSPRTIITWPCRCLCVCEDCRVSLALHNHGSCVTCRRSVGGFVRLFVP